MRSRCSCGSIRGSGRWCSSMGRPRLRTRSVRGGSRRCSLMLGLRCGPRTTSGSRCGRARCGCAGIRGEVMLPRVTIEGRAVADSELRFSQSGTAVGRIRLVASDRRKNPESGEWEDGDQLWIDVTCFKQLAENVAAAVLKGDLGTVVGKGR